MKTRNLSELYTIVLDYRKTLSLGDANQFICHAIDSCANGNLITDKERTKLFEHFRKNRPTSKLHVDFYKSPITALSFNSAWWYLVGEHTAEGVAIRDRFLEKMIKITSK